MANTQDFIQKQSGASAVTNAEDSIIYQDDANSRIGIGTTSPSSKLEIFDNTNNADYLTLRDGNWGGTAGTRKRIVWAATSSGAVVPVITIDAYLESATSAGLRFSTYDSSLNQDMVVFKPGGNVGIGETSPGAKLEVKGDSAGASSTEKALNVKNSDGTPVEMFTVLDAQDGNSNHATLFRSNAQATNIAGDIVVIPQDRTSTAIQQAVDYLVAAGNGGTVFLPAGNYQITAAIDIGDGSSNDGDGIRIIGASAEQTKLEIDSASAIDAIRIRGGSSTAAFVVIKNLWIDIASGGPDGLHTGINNEYGTDLLVEAVRIQTDSDTRRFRYGIKSACWNGLYEMCRVTDTFDAGVELTYDGTVPKSAHATTIDTDKQIAIESGKEDNLVMLGNRSRDVPDVQFYNEVRVRRAAGGDGMILEATGSGNSPFLTFKDDGSSASDKYSMRYDVTNKKFHLGYGDSSGFTKQVSIDQSSGDVGIGTTTPGTPLDVVGRSRIRGKSGDSAGGGLWLSDSSVPTSFISFIGRGSDSEDHVGIYSDSAWRLVVEDSDGNVGIGTTSPHYKLTVDGAIAGLERSSDPAEPNEGEFIIWMSDGTGKGDDGDVLIASKAGGTTKWTTLFDHSAGSSW